MTSAVSTAPQVPWLDSRGRDQALVTYGDGSTFVFVNRIIAGNPVGLYMAIPATYPSQAVSVFAPSQSFWFSGGNHQVNQTISTQVVSFTQPWVTPAVESCENFGVETLTAAVVAPDLKSGNATQAWNQIREMAEDRSLATNVEPFDDAVERFLRIHSTHALPVIEKGMTAFVQHRPLIASRILVVLGEVVDKSTIEHRVRVLAGFLAHANPAVRDSAALGLFRTGDSATVSLLREALARETHSQLRVNLAQLIYEAT